MSRRIGNINPLFVRRNHHLALVRATGRRSDPPSGPGRNSSAPIRPTTRPLARFFPLCRPSGQPPPKPRRSAGQPWVVLPGGLAQSNSPAWGGARHGGRREASGAPPFASRWVRIFSIINGSSMQTMILTAPPQAGQVSMSMPNTRFRRCAQVIEARRSASVGSSEAPVEGRRPPQGSTQIAVHAESRIMPSKVGERIRGGDFMRLYSA